MNHTIAGTLLLWDLFCQKKTARHQAENQIGHFRQVQLMSGQEWEVRLSVRYPTVHSNRNMIWQSCQLT